MNSMDHDVDATMATMVTDPYLLHVPTLTGGAGATEVRHFYERHFVRKWPADTKVSQILRTVGADQVVDALMLSFTHDVDWRSCCLAFPRPTNRWNSQLLW
jgi:carboxymethylenebutenolidase